MKKLLFRILLLPFLLLCSTLKGQSLYELTFEAEKVLYKGFLVYFNEEDAYMRVGYTYKGQYNVVDVKYKSATGQEDGYNYFVMVGSNPRFITNTAKGQKYNPDHILWIWNDKEDAGLPYITDDPNFDETHLQRCKSYREIKATELTDTYLRQFFRTDEPEFKALQKMRNAATGVASTNNNNDNTNTTNNNNTNNSSTAAKLHLVLFVNTDIPDIGQSCAVDQRVMETEFREISKAVGLPFQKYVLNGEKFTKANAEKVLQDLKVGKNDVVLFYYSGHGFRWSNQTDKYPQLDMRYSEYTPLSDKTSLALSDVSRIIASKGGRLNIILSDCCNSDIGRNQMTSTTFMASRAFQGAEIEKLKTLFLKSSGSMIITGSSPGEYSWCNVNGGFFTLSFIQSLKEEIGYMRNDAPSWEHIAQNAVKSTQYKAKNCNGCKPQNPIYNARITQN
jgi:hypothetical protein